MSAAVATTGGWRLFEELDAAGVRTIPQVLLHQAARFGTETLHRKKDFGVWQRYSFDDVVERVRGFALGLKGRGVGRGDTVAIVGENEPELFWSEYAAQAIGAKVVCLYPDLTPDQMEYILDHSDAVALICEDQEQVDKGLLLSAKLPRLATIAYWDERGMWSYRHERLSTFRAIEEEGRALLAADPEAFRREVEAGRGEDIAVLSYTSGTTGRPKACILTHESLLEALARMMGVVELRPGTQYLSYISPAWATEQFFGLTLGLLVPFVVNFPEEPETVQDNIREIGAEALMLSPRQWESLATLVEAKMMDAGPLRRAVYRWGMAGGRRANLARLEGRPVSLPTRLLGQVADWAVLSHLRDNLGLQSAYLAVSGGSGMAPDVFRFFHAMGVPLRNVYGTTEVGLLTLHQGSAYDLESVGTWMPTFPKLGAPLEHRITDEGELLVRGGAGFKGYYKNPDASAKKMVDGWFRMEDAVHQTPKGELVYLERLEDMRELAGGHRYPPQFIENRLRFSPFIRDAMTLGDSTRPFVAALINIDATTLGRWAEQRGIPYTTFTDLSQNEHVRALIRDELAAVNALLPARSRVLRFMNFPKELDPDEDELTRTRKLRRKHLEGKYASFIEAIYGGQTRLTTEIAVTYQDGRRGAMNVTVFADDVDPKALQAIGGVPPQPRPREAAHG